MSNFAFPVYFRAAGAQVSAEGCLLQTHTVSLTQYLSAARGRVGMARSEVCLSQPTSLSGPIKTDKAKCCVTQWTC